MKLSMTISPNMITSALIRICMSTACKTKQYCFLLKDGLLDFRSIYGQRERLSNKGFQLSRKVSVIYERLSIITDSPPFMALKT